MTKPKVSSYNNKTPVRNLDRTTCCSQTPSNIKYWEKHSKKPRPNTCTAEDCKHNDVIGAHVRYKNKGIKEQWIVPLCHHHNKRPIDEDITLVNETAMVEATESKKE